MITPFPHHKRPLLGTLFIQNSAQLESFPKNSLSDENQNSVIHNNGPRVSNEETGHGLPNGSASLPNGLMKTSLPNETITEDRNILLNPSENMLIISDAVDTSKVVPVLDQEQNSPDSNPSSRSSSGRMGRRRQSLPSGMKTGIKSVLKHGNPRDHMLANRPIKTVTFVESVTVVRVM